MVFNYRQKTTEQVLAYNPRSRGDDKYLQLKVWEQYGLYLSDSQQEKFLSKRLPAAESITRTRRKLQEGGKYLPVPKVSKARKQLAQETRYGITQGNLF